MLYSGLHNYKKIRGRKGTENPSANPVRTSNEAKIYSVSCNFHFPELFYDILLRYAKTSLG